MSRHLFYSSSPVPKSHRPARKHSVNYNSSMNNSGYRSSTLQRPPKFTQQQNSSKEESVSSRKFFQELERISNLENKEGLGSYSTMSLPRKMPVKKLVSVFNSQVHKTGVERTRVMNAYVQLQVVSVKWHSVVVTADGAFNLHGCKHMMKQDKLYLVHFMSESRTDPAFSRTAWC